MSLARPMLVAALAGACLATAAGTAAAKRAVGCGSSGYAYAGVAANDRSLGISATIVPLSAPQVLSGHVGAWVGVGGVGAGPGGTNEWLQVGFSGFPGSSSLNLYYEVAQPNQAPHYVEIESDLAPGTPRKVAVTEIRGRPNWWRVLVGGRMVGAPVRLAGSHSAWSPMATTESWGGGSFVCNRFRFRFTGLAVATSAAGSWRGFGSASAFHDHGYRIVRQSRTSFVAGGF